MSPSSGSNSPASPNTAKPSIGARVKRTPYVLKSSPSTAPPEPCIRPAGALAPPAIGNPANCAKAGPAQTRTNRPIHLLFMFSP